MSNENQQPVLTDLKVQQLINSIARYRELSESKIINPHSEIEIAGLKNFFADLMLNHGSEFVGCWVAIRTEYEPMIQVAARAFERITAINAKRNTNAN